MSGLLVASEVAALLRVDPSTLYGWRASGTGPRSFRLNGRVVWDADELAAWIEQQKNDTSK